jgi:thiol:disulfide interchange protein DsbD
MFWLGLLGVMAWSSLLAAPVRGTNASLELIAETENVQPGREMWVGVKIRHDPHWHTYWLNPGDSGLATKLTWKLPPGFQAGPVVWPVPQRVEIEGLVSYAYLDEVVLLTRLAVPATLPLGSPVKLEVQVDYLICKEICVPGKTTLGLTLPVLDTARPSPQADLIQKYVEAVPVPVPASAVNVTVEDKVWILEFQVPSAGLKDAYFYSTQEQTVLYGEKQVLTLNGTQARLRVPRDPAVSPDYLVGVLAGDTLRWEVVAPLALHPVSTGPGKVPTPTSWTLWAALGSALFGGLILNLMPCVLPVLSLKIFGLIQLAGGDRRVLFQHGMVFTVGVVTTFWALAGALLLLRAGGQQLGWGFQLQSPLFVFALLVLLFGVALNLLGVFEVGVTLTGAGGAVQRDGSLRGSFFNGVLATVVATPCTAPFMGSALGFAATQPAGVSLLIFTALGVGMAAPYLILSSQPAWLAFVPKPGAWMGTFKKALAFPMLATVIWLLHVLTLQTSAWGATAVLVGLLGLAIGAWIYGWAQIPVGSETQRRLGYAASALLGAGALLWTVQQIRVESGAPAESVGTRVENGLTWETFSPERVEQLRREGRTVFVDFTAAWCLSCQVNHKVVFGSEEVRQQFRDRNVATLKADWTRRDPVITQALAAFGRNGVPLYVLYRPGESTAQVLPEVLTPQIVLEALKKPAGQ